MAILEALGVAGSLLGGLGSAGSAILGGTQASKGGSYKGQPAAGYDPANDPVLNASQILTLQALGMPVDALIQAASPIQQLQNAISAPNAGTADRKRLQKTTQAVSFLGPLIGSLEAGSKTMDQVMADINSWGYYPALYQAAGLAGFSSIEDLIGKELSYRKQAVSIKAQGDALAPIIQQGRAGAQRGLADLQSNIIPGLTSQIMDYKLPGISEEEILAASNAERDRMIERVLQAANVGGFNPAAGLAEVNRDINPLANAIQLLQAKQNLGINELTALLNKGNTATQSLDSLYKSIFGPIGVANETAQVGLTAATQNASTAANQAIAAQQAQQNANQNKGSGYAGAGQTLGNTLATAPLLYEYFRDNQKQPGTQSGNDAGNTNYATLMKLFA